MPLPLLRSPSISGFQHHHRTTSAAPSQSSPPTPPAQNRTPLLRLHLSTSTAPLHPNSPFPSSLPASAPPSNSISASTIMASSTTVQRSSAPPSPLPPRIRLEVVSVAASVPPSPNTDIIQDGLDPRHPDLPYPVSIASDLHSLDIRIACLCCLRNSPYRFRRLRVLPSPSRFPTALPRILRLPSLLPPSQDPQPLPSQPRLHATIAGLSSSSSPPCPSVLSRCSDRSPASGVQHKSFFSVTAPLPPPRFRLLPSPSRLPFHVVIRPESASQSSASPPPSASVSAPISPPPPTAATKS